MQIISGILSLKQICECYELTKPVFMQPETLDESTYIGSLIWSVLH